LFFNPNDSVLLPHYLVISFHHKWFQYAGASVPNETCMQELSDMTAIKADDILSTLQSLDLIQYRKGQHVICADPKVLDRHLKAAGRGGLDVDVSKLIWTPYKEQG